VEILTAYFDPLLASQSGIYTCRATVQSLALERPQLLTSAVVANTQCKYYYNYYHSLLNIFFPPSSTTASNFPECTGYACHILCWNFIVSEVQCSSGYNCGYSLPTDIYLGKIWISLSQCQQMDNLKCHSTVSIRILFYTGNYYIE